MHWIVVILGLCLTAYSAKAMLDYLNKPGSPNSVRALVTMVGMVCGIGMVIFSGL